MHLIRWLNQELPKQILGLYLKTKLDSFFQIFSSLLFIIMLPSQLKLSNI